MENTYYSGNADYQKAYYYQNQKSQPRYESPISQKRWA